MARRLGARGDGDLALTLLRTEGTPMSEFERFLLHIRKLEANHSAAGQTLARERSKLIEMCPHERVVEENYVPSALSFNHTPPRRVCLDCQIWEEGWGAGYHVLGKLFGTDKNIPTVPRGHTPIGQRWAWCYGSKDHEAHAVPWSKLTKLGNTRCEEYEVTDWDRKYRDPDDSERRFPEYDYGC